MPTGQRAATPTRRPRLRYAGVVGALCYGVKWKCQQAVAPCCNVRRKQEDVSRKQEGHHGTDWSLHMGVVTACMASNG